jgi:hypothetical protein
MQRVELPLSFQDEAIITLPALSFRFPSLSSALHGLLLPLSASMPSSDLHLNFPAHKT